METSSANSEKCLVVLSGIPGCGKTTLAKLIEDHIDDIFVAERLTKKNLGVVIVSYDDLLPENNIILDDDSQQTWKSQREEIVLCVDYLLHYISSSVDKFEKSLVGVSGALWENFSHLVKKQLNSTQTVAIVIDDNMYYSSMRHRYFQLARKYTCGFCQVFLACDVQEALKRNRQRNNPVPDDIIVTMATKIEPPSQENTWETNSIIVNSQNDLQSHLQRVSTLVMTALANPVQPLEEIDPAVIAESRQICSSNVVHQADQILRKIVSQKMMDLKAISSLDKPDLQKISKQYVDVRKLCLDKIKTGEVITLKTINQTDIPSDKNSELYQEILKIFEQLLKDVT